MEEFKIVCSQCGKHIRINKLVPHDRRVLWSISHDDDSLIFEDCDNHRDLVRCACGNDITADFEKIVYPVRPADHCPIK